MPFIGNNKAGGITNIQRDSTLTGPVPTMVAQRSWGIGSPGQQLASFST